MQTQLTLTPQLSSGGTSVRFHIAGTAGRTEVYGITDSCHFGLLTEFDDAHREALAITRVYRSSGKGGHVPEGARLATVQAVELALAPYWPQEA